MIDDFIAQWGQPDVATGSSVFFARGDPGYRQWKRLSKKAKPGIWAHGFLSIATPELAEVNDALSAWGFALGTDDPTRQVLLRNGYGDVVFSQNKNNVMAVTRVLSPRLTKVYDPDLRPWAVALRTYSCYHRRRRLSWRGA